MDADCTFQGIKYRSLIIPRMYVFVPLAWDGNDSVGVSVSASASRRNRQFRIPRLECSSITLAEKWLFAQGNTSQLHMDNWQSRVVCIPEYSEVICVVFSSDDVPTQFLSLT
jgi:hypothetical protein